MTFKKKDGQKKIIFGSYFQIIIKVNDLLREVFRYNPSSIFFDSDTRLVQDYLLNSFTIHNGHIKVNENLMATLNDDAPVHVDYDFENP